MPGGGHLFSVVETPELQASLDLYHFKAGKYLQARAVAASAEESRQRYELVNGKRFPAELRYLLFVPDASLARNVPLVVYFPGSGETGFDLAKQFRQKSLFSIISSKKFQNQHPCYFMAISLPDGTRTMYDGLPGQPSAMQDLVMGAIRTVAASYKKPKIDMTRLYTVGFSFGGECVYGIMLAYPDAFAGGIPVASFPPPPNYVSRKHPGAWWHIYNDGDYTVHGVTGDMLKPFVDRVEACGGEFRTGTYPCDGHNAWTAAWQETAAWEWLFSKSTDGRVVKDSPLRPDLAATDDETEKPEAEPNAEKPFTPSSPRRSGKSEVEKRQRLIAKDISKSKCSSSVQGKGRASQPYLAVDGLDGTAYVSETPVKKGDWFKVELPESTVGTVCVKTGHLKAKDYLADGSVETSYDGQTWKRRGKFEDRTGECEFRLKDEPVKFIRILPASKKPQILVIREITIVP